MIDIKEITEGHMKIMRGIIESGQLKSGEPAMPLVLWVTKDDRIIPIGVPMVGEAGKDQVSEVIRGIVELDVTLCAIFICEAYVLTNIKDRHLDRIPARLKDVPGREEAIAATIHAKGMKTRSAEWIFDRDAAGKPVFRNEIRWSGLGETSVGRFGDPEDAPRTGVN